MSEIKEVETVKKLQTRVKSKEKEYKEVIYKKVGVAKPPTKTFHQRLSYDFLQYIRVIFKWACSNHDISRPNLELLLGLYPLGIFKRTDFEVYCKTVDMNPKRLLTKLINDGWIKIWRPFKHKQAALYCLTNRGKILCGKMHKMCVGESKIPESKYNNTLITSEKTIDKFYMDVIKKMNQRDLNDAKDVVNDSDE